MDILIGLGVIALVAYIAYKRFPSFKAKVDGFWTKE